MLNTEQDADAGIVTVTPDYFDSLISKLPKILLLESTQKKKGRYANSLHCITKIRYEKIVAGLSDRVHIGLEYIPDGPDGPYVLVIDDYDVINTSDFHNCYPDDFNDLVTGFRCLYRVELDGNTLCKHHLLTGKYYEDVAQLNKCVHNLYGIIVAAMEKISDVYGAAD